MRLRRRVAVSGVALAAALVIAAVPATAQPGSGDRAPCAAPAASSSAEFGGAIYAVLAGTEVNVSLCGSLVVTYHGDPARDCVRLDLCGVSGELIWTPTGAAELFVISAREGRRTVTTGQLAEFGGFEQPAGVVSAVTRIAPDGSVHECADGSASSPSLSVAKLPSGLLRIGGPDASVADALADSRCAVPLGSELTPALPSATLSSAALHTAGTVIDLSGTHAFAGPGLSGTVSSTLTVVTGKAHLERPTSSPPVASGSGHKQSFVQATLAVEQVGGSISARIAGPTDSAACAVLDACGLSESLILTPRGKGTVELSAELPTGAGSLRSRLQRSSRLSGLGIGELTGNGSVQAIAARDDGSPTCTDTAPLTVSDFEISTVRGRAEVAALIGGTPDAFRTSCPGPDLSDFAAPLSGLVGGSVKAADLFARSVTIVLHRATSGVSADGFAMHATSTLRIRLRLRKLSIVRESS